MQDERLFTVSGGRPRLTEGRREQVLRQRRRFRRRWYICYMITAIAVIVLTLTVLLAGVSSRTGIFHSKGARVRYAEAIGRRILGLDFMDLSLGKGSDGEEQSTSNVWEELGELLRPDPNATAPVAKPEKPPVDTLTPEELYAYDASAVPEGYTPIQPMDLALTAYGNTYIHNETSYVPDCEALLGRALSVLGTDASSGAPQVLILHTHTSEAYCEEGALGVPKDGELARSQNGAENVVAVGEVMAEVLNSRGIRTLHCRITHDAPGYKDSYARAEETIRSYLSQYPSIRLVIDLHRDAVIKSTGEIGRPVAIADGEAAAQLMCVVGSDQNGTACPAWQNNLALALGLRQALNAAYDNVCRPPYLRKSSYNQELAPYSLLLEVGACGNSLTEARRTARITANALAELLLD